MGRATCKHDPPGASALNLTQHCQKCLDEAIHEVTCICLVCVKDRHITSICRHRKPEVTCQECVEQLIEYKAAVENIRVDKELEYKKSYTSQPRKSVARINIRDYTEQVVLHTDKQTGAFQYWTLNTPEVVLERDAQPGHCYLFRQNAITVEELKKLVTIHTCSQHMVVVDWTAGGG